jgi:ATP-dependent helicase/nuclease subunit B
MGSNASPGVDAWLRQGGIVVTASDRAARALRTAFSRARLAESLTAWPAPPIHDWRTFVRNAWIDHASDARLVLNAAQEQSIWAQIAERSRQPATLLDGPRHRIATLAMDAHELLCAYAPRYLHAGARGGWQQDAASFSQWLDEFESICREGQLLSENRIPLELAPALERSASPQRPPLLLVGFDRILPAQRAVLDRWGEWHEAQQSVRATNIQYFHAEDSQAEFTACALWCHHQLALSPQAQLLVIAQDIGSSRGQLERALLRYLDPAAAPPYEFSLGIPLGAVPLARAAFLLLRWLSSAIEESEVDWLFSTSLSAANPSESAALPLLMRELRRRDHQRTQWTLDALFREPLAGAHMPPAWQQRMRQAQSLLAAAAGKPQSPLDWASLVPQLLEAIGWPGFRPLSSLEFQAMNRWSQALEVCASLGFNGRLIDWHDFLAALSRTLEETLFAPESRHASILIAGPAETAGLTADGLWFLGADDTAWPPGGSPHPFLPIAIQRESGMPHATAQLDWDLAHRSTTRILASAPAVTFSYAQQQKAAETRASRIVVQFAGEPQPLPAAFVAPAARTPLTVAFSDVGEIPFPHATVSGGANILTLQSQCPFKAFAVARLGAEGWGPAQAGLTAAQRGKLLHSVMHSIWSGKPPGIGSIEELNDIADLQTFVASHVRSILDREIPAGLREQMPRRYLELEKPRLVRLIAAWLEYERTRQSFAVAATEVDSNAVIAGLTFRLRLDRFDRLNDGTFLIVDYKTGDISPASWDPPRPDDVQLPLYAAFALDPDRHPLGGLAFAKIRPGDTAFAARAVAPLTTLFSDLTAAAARKATLSPNQLNAWRLEIERLAHDFLAGRADVDPKQYPKTCERCDLHAVCRIDENRARSAEEDENEEDGIDE